MERLLLAHSRKRLHHYLVVDLDMMGSYVMFMLCLAILCLDQIGMRKHRKK